MFVDGSVTRGLTVVLPLAPFANPVTDLWTGALSILFRSDK